MRTEVDAILSLTGDDFRNVVLNNARALSHQVENLPDEARRRLIDVVEGSWPERGVRANVERRENQIIFHDRDAHAWLTLAPALDVAPTAEQWADLAISGAVMTDTSTWLERHYTEDGALLAAHSCDESGARPWADLVSAIPPDVRLPEEVVDAIVTHLREPTVREPDFELWHIGDRFVREERLDALQALSEANAELDRRLRSWRARLGETQAARSLLEDLVAAVQEGARFDRDDAHWLDGVADPALLPPLFGALAAAVTNEGESPFGVSGGISRAIQRIGGDDAVRMYDELIDSSDDSRFKFLRLQRDEIVQAELRAVGQRHVAEVAERLNVPVLETGATIAEH